MMTHRMLLIGFCAVASVARLSSHVAAETGTATEPLRVIAYNVFECLGWPKDRARAQTAVATGEMAQRLADELARYRPDIINFSESPTEPIAQEVAKRLGMHHVRFPSGGKWPGTILSRFEVVESANAPMVDGGARPADLFTRHWGRATLRLPNGELLVVHSAHLMPGPDPAVRLREIHAMVQSMQADLQSNRSLLLLGDLNHGPDTPEYQAWRDAGLIDTFQQVGQGLGYTFRSDIPKIRIDYIMAHGPIIKRIESSRPLSEGAFRLRIDDNQSFALSDHLPQFATFAAAEPAPAAADGIGGTGALPTGYRTLFNGTSLEGWIGNDPHQTNQVATDQRAAAVAAQQAEFQRHWHADHGELVNDGQGPYATTIEEFGDIELRVDYQTVARADSGIYLRGTPQIQIWDTTESGGKWDRHADRGSGGLFNNRPGFPGQLPLHHADRPFGEWNNFRIRQLGSRTTVWLNEQLVVDRAIMENYWDNERKLPLAPRGPIHLQTHGGEIRWKNIVTREILADEANRHLRGDDTQQGFHSIFNGVDLTGWDGTLDDFEVRDGAIVCKAGRGGVLHTKDEYRDFIVRLEFLLSPGGNSGLAIRYPGHGRASYDAMAELQVLDDTADQYAQLDPRQYHGSAYGMAAASRGYLRPVGHWNYQEITVRGAAIQVELNGTVILDTDLSQITEYKDNAPHPGKELSHGYFGFAGHNDPVMYRNIAIKKL